MKRPANDRGGPTAMISPPQVEEWNFFNQESGAKRGAQVQQKSEIYEEVMSLARPERDREFTFNDNEKLEFQNAIGDNMQKKIVTTTYTQRGGDAESFVKKKVVV